jgi:hypothetical protein
MQFAVICHETELVIYFIWKNILYGCLMLSLYQASVSIVDMCNKVIHYSNFS